MQTSIPGTTIPFEGGGSMFSMFRPLIKATNGLTLGQVCSITGLEPSTVQNWVKRGFVSHPVNKKYRERQLARILLISSLRDSMQIDRIGELMTMVNGSADDESDDIISEERMYDYLCALIGKTLDSGSAFSELPGLVDEVTADYSQPFEGAEQRLNEALLVMAYAYIAGRYKQEAERRFGKMKENNNG